MCGIIASISTMAVGALLVVGSCIISFLVVPGVIENIIISETVLQNDTIQMERFEEVPFALDFSVRIFNLSNSEEFLQGATPVMTELGPYVYKLYQTREIIDMEEDIIRYRRHERFEFDTERSFPYTEDDMVTIVNVPYHAILQVAQREYPNLASLLYLAMNGIFAEHNAPVATFRVQDLLMKGIPLCKTPGLIGGIACGIIREIAESAKNMALQEDGSLLFSALAYKQDAPSGDYEVYRGINDHTNLGHIISYNQSPNFTYWVNDIVQNTPEEMEETEEEVAEEKEEQEEEDKEEGKEVKEEEEKEKLSVCNMINGTDSGIYAPLLNRDTHIYAINTDICRSVELRYELETEYKGIPTARFAANDWLLDNNDGCFCLNHTVGINRYDGCLLKGAMELSTCVGAYLVLSYPHFLFADEAYRKGVIGMNPVENDHKILLDIEPNTGTPVRGFKRAQFNIFARPISGIPDTANLPTVLVPFLWVEEGIHLPDEFVDELTTRLLNSLRLVDILIPLLIVVCCAVFVLGVALTIRAKYRKQEPKRISF